MGRRSLLKGAGGLAATPALARAQAEGAASPPAPRARPDLTGRLARYMAAAPDRPLPDAVVRDAKHRILDTLGAIVSGSTLLPGELTISYLRAQGGAPQARVAATGIRTTAVDAAFAMGMFAHADETDDFDPVTKSHPGSCVVPAALAMADKEGRSGRELIAAVVLGYDLCCRLLMALGPDLVRATNRSAEGVSSTFGALGAAAALARLDEQRMRWAISYAAQQVAGLWTWERDTDHVEKAFDFAGMGARNGVAAVSLVQAGFTGVSDVLDGPKNMIGALSSDPQPEALVSGLGERFYVSESAIKVFSVGYPIQAPLDAFLSLRRQHGLTPDNVRSIVVRLPTDGAGIVDNRAMPDVNLQHLMGVALIDGTISFEMSHSRERMADPAVRAIRERVQLIADPALMDPQAPRSGRVQVTMSDGRVVEHFTRHPPGTRENPLDTDAVGAKAHGLLAPVFGEARADAIVEQVGALENLASVRELAAALATTR